MDTHPSVPFANTYWAVSGQLLAGEHPADADEDATTAKLSALLDAGVRTFVDLTEEHETNGYYPALRTLADERRLEITYLNIPFPDRSVPSVWTMRLILDVLDHSLADENAVFVHCFAGRGRTGAVVGCFLKRHGHATEADVVRKIAELRRFMPIGRESSPHTPEQVRMVEQWKVGA